MVKFSSRRLLCWAPLLPALLVAASAWGRAGGGDDYSSGSGSGGSSDDGSLGLLWFLIQLAFDYPIVGIPLLVVCVLYVMLHNSTRRGTPLTSERGMTRVISSAVQARETGRVGGAVDRIRQRDSAFDEQRFLARARDAFLKIQQAWSRQDMAPARAFVSDGVMERFAIQIEMQKADGLRNEMSAVNVIDCRIVEAESDAHFDTLHLRLQASAVDSKLALADGRRLGGSGEPTQFVEIWSFLRRPGAQTLAQPGLIEGYCPSCGAPLNIGDAAQCASCKAWINSGQYDWVLCEITQESEWALRGSGENVPGFSALARRDPLLSTPFLEDRASVAFWRWQRALSQGGAKALLPVATPDFCKSWEADAAARQFRFRDAAVGAVEVRAFEQNEGMDLAHLRVRWSGAQFEAGSGRQVSGTQPRDHVFVLERRADARTDDNAGLNSCRCPNCGAPPSSRDIAACEYCGTSFNDGSRQWVVGRILPIALWRMPGAAAVTDAPPPDALPAAPAVELGWVQGLSTSEVLAILVAAMMSDGNIDPAERKYLDRYAVNNHVPAASIDGLIEAARRNQLEIPKAQTPVEAHACLNGLIEMSLADGKVDPAELKLILLYAESNGIERNKVIQTIKERRLSLFQQAR